MSYDREKRKKRRQRNLMARELRDPKYRPRVVKPKEKEKPLREILKELEKDGELDVV